MERENILKILKVRGYQLPDDLLKFIKSNDEELLTYKTSNTADKLYVFFPENEKVGVITIRQYIKTMETNEVLKAIIVVGNNITAFAKQESDEHKSLSIEYFKKNELLIDKLTHVLVPPHVLLSIEEKNELLKVYKVKEINLPKMSSLDPIARYFGAKKGQVFQILRNTETSGISPYYRIVV